MNSFFRIFGKSIILKIIYSIYFQINILISIAYKMNIANVNFSLVYNS